MALRRQVGQLVVVSADADVGGADRVQRRPFVDVAVGEVVNSSHQPTLRDRSRARGPLIRRARGAVEGYRGARSETRAPSVVPRGQSGHRDRPSGRTRGTLAARLSSLLAAIWGCSFLFIKVAVAQLGPFYVTLARVGIGALTLLVALALLRERLPRDPRLWLHLFVVAIADERRARSPCSASASSGSPRCSPASGTPPPRWSRWWSCSPCSRRSGRRGNGSLGLLVGFLGVLTVLGVWHGVGGAALDRAVDVPRRGDLLRVRPALHPPLRRRPTGAGRVHRRRAAAAGHRPARGGHRAGRAARRRRSVTCAIRGDPGGAGAGRPRYRHRVPAQLPT